MYSLCLFLDTTVSSASYGGMKAIVLLSILLTSVNPLLAQLLEKSSMYRSLEADARASRIARSAGSSNTGSQNITVKEIYQGESPFVTPWLREYFAGSGQVIEPGMAEYIEAILSPCGPLRDNPRSIGYEGPRLTKGVFKGKTLAEAVNRVILDYKSSAYDIPQTPFETEQSLSAKVAAHEQQRSADSLSQFDAAVEASRKRVVEFFPEAAEENHPIHVAAEAIATHLEKNRSPLLIYEDAPFVIYCLAADKIGLIPVQQ